MLKLWLKAPGRRQRSRLLTLQTPKRLPQHRRATGGRAQDRGRGGRRDGGDPLAAPQTGRGLCSRTPHPGSRTPTAALGPVGGPGHRGGPGTLLSPCFPSFTYFPTRSYRPPEPVSQGDAAPGSHRDGQTSLSGSRDAGEGSAQGRAARDTPVSPKKGVRGGKTAHRAKNPSRSEVSGRNNSFPASPPARDGD